LSHQPNIQKSLKFDPRTNAMQRLKAAGARPNILELNCGHYSLGMPPYILLAGLSLKRFLSFR
jgi:hypothetical protein